MRRIEKAVKAVPGVRDAQVNLVTHRATVTTEPGVVTTERLASAIEAAGYEPVLDEAAPASATDPVEERAAAIQASEDRERRVLRRDFVFATAPSTTATSGAKLFVVSGTSEQILWESIAMGSGFSDINDVLVIPPQTAGAASELVAVLPGSLRAYNSQTLLLDWVIPATNTGAAYIADGVAGPEFVTWQTNGAVTFYDAATQAYLRAFSLASPLSALTVLQGGEGSLLAAADNRLELVAGNDGSVLAASDPLGELWSMAPLAAPAAVPTGTSSWHVALASQPALWRMQMDATDRIFLGTFDSP